MERERERERRDLQQADGKGHHQDQLLVDRQVQTVEVRHGEEEDGEVRDEVEGARDLVGEDLVAAVAVGDGLVPVEGKGAADQEAHEDSGQGPHDNDGRGDLGRPDKGGDGKDLGVEKEDRDFAEAEAESPEKLDDEKQLRQVRNKR